jgi:flavin reductase (DIM6/NTAB) family NADH-FMN oxidoreductase RutF
MIDTHSFRQTLGCFPTGVAIATTQAADGQPVGLTVSSFNSVSLEPPLILWSLAEGSDSRDSFNAATHFAINILSAGQAELCTRFSAMVGNRFDGYGWQPGTGGVPVLDGVLAVLECRVWARYPGGDHVILVGEVLAHSSDREKSPLVYAGGKLTGLR